MGREGRERGRGEERGGRGRGTYKITWAGTRSMVRFLGRAEEEVVVVVVVARRRRAGRVGRMLLNFIFLIKVGLLIL